VPHLLSWSPLLVGISCSGHLFLSESLVFVISSCRHHLFLFHLPSRSRSRVVEKLNPSETPLSSTPVPLRFGTDEEVGMGMRLCMQHCNMTIQDCNIAIQDTNISHHSMQHSNIAMQHNNISHYCTQGQRENRRSEENMGVKLRNVFQRH